MNKQKWTETSIKIESEYKEWKLPHPIVIAELTAIKRIVLLPGKVLNENLYNLVNGKQLYFKLLNFSMDSPFTVACLPPPLPFPLYMSSLLLVTTGLASDLSWLQTLNHNSLLFLNKLIYCWRNNICFRSTKESIYQRNCRIWI